MEDSVVTVKMSENSQKLNKSTRKFWVGGRAKLLNRAAAALAALGPFGDSCGGRRRKLELRSFSSAESLLSAPRAAVRQASVGSAAETGGLFGDAQTLRRRFLGVSKFALIFLIKIDAKWEPLGSLFWHTFSIFRAPSGGSNFLCFWVPLSRCL